MCPSAAPLGSYGGMLSFFAGVDLADERFGSDHHLTVDILVGLDQHWQLLKDGMIRTSAGLVAQETIFGWIISGSVTGKVAQETIFGWIISGSVTGKVAQTTCQLLLLNDVPEQVLRDL